MVIKRNHLFKDAFNKFDMEILDSGYSRCDSEWNIKNIISPFSRIYLIESGEATIRSGGEVIVMKSGNAYIIPTGLTCSWSCDNAYTKLFFHFTLNKPDGYDILADLGKFYTIPVGIDTIKKLISCYNSTNSCDMLYIKSKLYDIISDIIPSEKLDLTINKKYSDITKEAIRFITSNLNLHLLSLSLIAEHMHISETRLSKIFKNDLDITIKKYINDQIFYEAEKMLLKTHWPISKISESLGFYDQFYFSKRFKKRYGISPLEYRNKYNLEF